MDTPVVAKLPFHLKIVYALGQFGWCLSSYSAYNLIHYFYFPPETDKPLFPTFITQHVFFGVITLIGAIVSFGRLFDAFIDPYIANLSDNCSSRLGRRRIFMAIGAVPAAFLPLLMFLPPVGAESSLNVLWFAVTSFFFYITFAIYTIPYTALMSELGHRSEERLFLSTLIAFTWALGFAFGNSIYALQEPMMDVMRHLGSAEAVVPTRAFQASVGIFSAIGLIFMLLPVALIDERKYCVQTPSHLGTLAAIKSTLKNRNFVTFVVSDFIYWIALTFIQSGIAYYITILLKLPQAFTTTILMVMFFTSFIFFYPTNVLAKRIGKKPLLMIAFILDMIVFGLFAFMGIFELDPYNMAFIAAGIASIPMAIFTILPNAVIADIAEAHAASTGEHQAGMFFASRTLTMKAAAAFAALILPTVLALGKSQENSLGVRVSAVVAAVLCALGMLVLLRFNEPIDRPTPEA